VQALAAIETDRPGFPAPEVYRSLLAYWRAAADPGNPALIEHFRDVSAQAIQITYARTQAHPNDAEAWRYYASALGQRSQFAVSVAPNNGDIVRYGLKARDAVIKAHTMDPSDRDILIGLGAANYFAASIPWFLKPIAFAMGVRGGDRELGLQQIRQGMSEGPHSRVEGAMVLAGAMYSEENYDEFYKVITKITSAHPSLLPAASWAISGCICGKMFSEGRKTALDAQADEAWRDLQMGRIALASNELHDAEEAFTKSIGSQTKNHSVLAWAYYGRALARKRSGRSDDGDLAHAKQASPTAFQLASRQFLKPGGCRP
jgi:hypothetical protein